MNSNYYTPQSNSEIRRISRDQLDNKWGAAALTILVYVIISSVLSAIPISIPGPGLPSFGNDFLLNQSLDLNIASMLCAGALSIGLYKYHLNIAQNQRPELGVLFDGFQQFGQSILAYILINIIVGIGILFFIVPGIIFALGLSQTFFIMAENPGIKATDAMQESWEMMKGNKMQLFFLGLSFIGWILLTVFTLFIGMLWVIPYIYVSFANFYKQIRGEKEDVRLDDLLVDFK